MTYDFGDIIDARTVPKIEHFIVVLGEISRKDKITDADITEVMYYKITSHVYAVFKSILAYFNHCLSRKDKHFIKFYPKEKDNLAIPQWGLLCQAVFLDRDRYYSTCLDVESMVVASHDPNIIDKKAIETLRKDGKISFRTKLTKFDAVNLMNVIKHSDGVSPERRGIISNCFLEVSTKLK